MNMEFIPERTEKMKRFGWVIGAKEEKLDEYKKLHANVWPEVLKMLSECNFTNYSIYLRKLPDGNATCLVT